MKKICLIAACFAAIASLQAQTVNLSEYAAAKYQWNASESPATATYEFESPYTEINGIRFYNNEEDVFSIDYNRKKVDGVRYFACAKTHGGSKWEDSETPSSRIIAIDVTGPCTISGVFASSSKTDDREMFFSTAKVDSKVGKNDISYVGSINISAEAGAATYSFEYKGEATTLYIYSLKGGINIYTIGVAYK